MPVEVNPEPKEVSPPYEKCTSCNTTTTYWWAFGCMPLCPKCAKEFDYKTAYERAVVCGYGPLPPAPLIVSEDDE